MKTPNTTTAVAIPQFSKVSPKPTKTEILEALVQRAKVKHDLEEESRKIKAKSAYDRIIKISGELLKKDAYKAYVYTVSTGGQYVQYKIEAKSPELTKAIIEYGKVQYGSSFDYQATKRLLREKLAGAPERCRLLDSPEAVQALDHMLETLA